MSAAIYSVPATSPVAGMGAGMGKAPDDPLPPMLDQLNTLLHVSGYLHAELALMERTLGLTLPDVASSGSKNDSGPPPSMSDYIGMLTQNLGVLYQRLQTANSRLCGGNAQCGMAQGSQG